jgi:hypothetical protein
MAASKDGGGDAARGAALAARMLGPEGWAPTGAEAVTVGLAAQCVPLNDLHAAAMALAETWIAAGRLHRAVATPAAFNADVKPTDPETQVSPPTRKPSPPTRKPKSAPSTPPPSSNKHQQSLQVFLTFIWKSEATKTTMSQCFARYSRRGALNLFLSGLCAPVCFVMLWHMRCVG